MTSYTWFATEKKLSRKLLSKQKQNWHLQILWSVKANYLVSKCVSIRTLCGRQFHFNFGFDSGLTIWLLSVKCILSTGAFIYKLLLLQSSRLLLLSQAQENTKEKKSSLSSFWAYKLIVCTREYWADRRHMPSHWFLSNFHSLWGSLSYSNFQSDSGFRLIPRVLEPSQQIPEIEG